MLHKARNLQRVDYIKVLYPQETNSSNQGLEIDIKHTILGQTTNYGCGAKAKTTDQPCARNPSGLLRILGSY